jgi:Predicted membrane protein (DUF2142)
VERVNWRWWASFALFAVMGLAWVLATPIFAAPDEPAHVIRAVSVGHGQLLGDDPVPPVPPMFGSTLQVKAPAIYNHVNLTCFIGRRDTSANCLKLTGSRADTEVNTYVAHHPPAYYAAVGFLSRWVRPGENQVLVMRALGMLAIAALLASALESLRRVAAPVWAGAGFAVALSPMVMFLAGTVSPSGIEIGAAMGVWVHGAVLAREADRTIDPRLVDRLGIAACVLVLSRALSPVWLGVIGLVLLILMTRAGLRAFLHARRVRIWAGALVASLAFYGWWFVYGQPLAKLVGTPVHESVPNLLMTSFGKTDEMLRQMVGVFGWLETRAPGATFLVWVIALGGIAALLLAVGSARFAWALLAATAATVVLPVIVESVGASKSGFIWQGRYTLPLAVGVPILAGIGAGSAEGAARLARRLAVVLCLGLLIAQFLAFAQALRRYSVGSKGPVWFFSHERWAPPIPSSALVVIYALATAAALWWIVLAPTSRTRRPRSLASAASARSSSAPTAEGVTPVSA